MKRVARWLIHLIGLLMVLAFGGALYQRVASMRDLDRFQPPGQLVDIGGRQLHLVCAGSGSPTVILEASGLGRAHEWQAVQAEVAKRTRVCAYDRAGMGYSDTGPTPRDTRHLVDDLAALLRAARIAPPYVLVGDSAGGLVARLYAAENPDEVKGLVLVDALPEDLPRELPRVWAHLHGWSKRAQALVRLGALRLFNPLHLDAEDRALTYRSEAIDSAADLLDHVADDARQLAAAPLPRDLPLIVVTHGKPGDWAGPVALNDAAENAWQAAQVRLAAKSSKGRVVVAAESGHQIAREQPRIIVDATFELVARAGK
jgi:pimeloyl-ACP methyl ester carboxylesterase